ncbi:MAG: B12-binding domain-containing radical SAM protein [Bacillota bacterium]
MSIALVVPPYIQDKSFRSTLFNPVGEHLGLECVLASAISSGLDVECLSCPIEQLDCSAAADRLLQRNPAVIGISVNYEQADFLGAVILAKELRSKAFNGLLVAGGMAATFLAKELLTEAPFDVVVRGEGESTFPRLAQAYIGEEDWRNLPGLTFLDGEEPIATPDAPLLSFESLPPPDRRFLQRLPWLQTMYGIPVETSRGCWCRCSFCLVPEFHGKEWRARDLSKVVQEIRSIHNDFGAETYEFVDDNFFGPPQLYDERSKELASLLRTEKLNINFALSCRADAIERDRLQRLTDVGLGRLYLGIESGSPAMLRRMVKGTTVDQNRRAIETLASLEFPVNCCLIMFDPFTTIAELRETIAFLRETGAYRLGMRPYNLINSLLVLRGTPIYGQLQNSGLLKPVSRLTYSYSFESPQVDAVHKVVSSLDGWISPLDLKFRSIFPRYKQLISELEARGFSKGRLRGIPQIHWDFMNKAYWDWYNSLPGLVLSVLDSVVTAVESGMSDQEGTVQLLKTAAIKRVNERLIECFREELPFKVFDDLKRLVASPVDNVVSKAVGA